MKEVFVYVVESYFKNFVIDRKYFLNFSQQTFTYIRMLYKELLKWGFLIFYVYACDEFLRFVSERPENDECSLFGADRC